MGFIKGMFFLRRKSLNWQLCRVNELQKEKNNQKKKTKKTEDTKPKFILSARTLQIHYQRELF